MICQHIKLLLLTFIAVLQSCNPKSDIAPKSEEWFTQDSIIGYSDDLRLDEISGLIPSQNNLGFFWVHNDGGDAPHVYLVDSTMKVVQTVRINESIHYQTTTDSVGNAYQTAFIGRVRNIDWEDITLQKINEQYHIIIGDIGDNIAQRDSVFLYRFPEPIFQGDSTLSVTAEKMILQYAEGARDVETLMTDPLNNEIILLSKRDPQVKLYAFLFEPRMKTVTSQGQLGFTYLTAGDINSDGDVLLKDYNKVYLFENDKHISALALLLQSSPEEVHYIEELQGEAICWGLDNRSYFATSERRDEGRQPFYWYY